jgi:hypothetical protein
MYGLYRNKELRGLDLARVRDYPGGVLVTVWCQNRASLTDHPLTSTVRSQRLPTQLPTLRDNLESAMRHYYTWTPKTKDYGENRRDRLIRFHLQILLLRETSRRRDECGGK